MTRANVACARRCASTGSPFDTSPSECLNEHEFLTLDEARDIIEAIFTTDGCWRLTQTQVSNGSPNYMVISDQAFQARVLVAQLMHLADLEH
jgi:hypothetical protein